MKKILALIIIIGGFGIGFFGIPFLLGNTAKGFAALIKDGDETAVTDRISYIAELSVIDYEYKNVAKIEESREVEAFKKDISVPFTRKTIVMEYEGDIKLGVDTTKITVNTDKNAAGSVKKVTVTFTKV